MKINEKTRVSVIIPCYNRQDFIKETIDSVINQTYVNIEIIAVDDGSSDGTRSIIDTYRNQITILEHPGRINKGQSAAINLGLKHCTGEYVAILDSDDVFCPEKIEKQVRILDSMPEIGIVYGNGFYINERSEKLYEIFPDSHKETNDPVRMLLECYFNIPSNSLVRKSVYDRTGGYDESMRSSQDHDMGIRIMEVTRAYYINDILWYYRRHGDSQSGRHAMRRWQTGFRILEKAVQRYPYGKRVELKRKGVLHFRVGQCYFEEKYYFKALKHFIMAGICDPFRSVRVILKKETVTGPH